MFADALKHRLARSLDEFHRDNYDKHRFGERTYIRRFKDYLRFKLGHHRKNLRFRLEKIVEPYFDKLENTSKLLADDQSRELLVDLMAYRILGFRHIKLPTNTPQYWKILGEQTKIIDQAGERINTAFMHFWLGRTRINRFGVDVEVFIQPRAIMSQLFLSQYRFERKGTIIGIEPGDTVFDCGGCWGETAVFFAYLAGNEGQVVSFEFIPSNLKIFRQNVDLNPNLRDRIQIIENPLWSTAREKLYFSDNGPGSKLKTEPFDGMAGTVEIATIDQVVKSKSLDKVDFVKMDIEGAELDALKGGESTIRKFKPKLAISLYHSLDDFCDIPAYLDSLNLGYQFYLHHATIHTEETVLFAHIPAAASIPFSNLSQAKQI